MLPTAKNGHVFHEYVPKHMKISNPDDSRRINRQFYGDLPPAEIVELIALSKSDSDLKKIVMVQTRITRSWMLLSVVKW